MAKKIAAKQNNGTPTLFVITACSRLFNLTNQPNTKPSSNVIIYGHVKSAKTQTQIVVSRGYTKKDIAIKKGSTPQRELEILLPPSQFDNLVELLSHKPKICSFNTTVTPPEFQIVVEY